MILQASFVIMLIISVDGNDITLVLDSHYKGHLILKQFSVLIPIAQWIVNGCVLRA